MKFLSTVLIRRRVQARTSLETASKGADEKERREPRVKEAGWAGGWAAGRRAVTPKGALVRLSNTLQKGRSTEYYTEVCSHT